MAITINGNGTVTGVSVGGLPDGIVQLADLGATSGKNGPILEIKQTVISSQISDSVAQNTWEDITGLSVSITPSSATSKILVFYHASVSATKGSYTQFLRILRDSTAVGIGDTSGSRVPSTTWKATDSTDYYVAFHDNMFLDSPSTTSATTYKLQWRSSYSGETFYLNRAVFNGDSNHYATQISQITAMEVAA